MVTSGIKQTKQPIQTMGNHSQVSWRAIALGLILIPVNCYWIVHIELVQFSAQPTTVSLIFTVVFSVFVLTLLNLLLKQFLPKLALRQGELLVVYVMLSVASATAGVSMVEILVPILGHAFYHATLENDWSNLLWRHIPEWLSVDNKRVLSGYYDGDSTLYTVQHIKSWLTPVMSWFAFLFALVFVMVCINVIVRKQWTEKEKLAYPIIQLPYGMTGEGFFKNKLMWIAFGIVVSFDIINGLHLLFPVIPRIFARSYSFGFTNKPWNAMGWVGLGIYPFVMGIGFLIPLDLLFSCWFFFWLWKAQLLLGGITGWQTSSGLGGESYPYVNYQGFGGYIGIFLIALWMSRKHLLAVFKKLFGRGELDDSDEPMTYRAAILALASGVAFLALFCYKAGMSLWVILIFFVLYFALSTAISRMRAELGSPMHDLHYTGPEEVMVATTGTRKLGPSNLTMFSFFWFITRTFDCHPMPHQLEGFKLAERVNIKNRRFLFAMLLAIGVGILSQFWALLSISYRLGAANRMSVVPMIYGREPWNRLQTWLINPVNPNYPAVGFAAVGLLFAFFLFFMRMKFFWWPFHPAAYAAVSGSWAIAHAWFSLWLAWVTKLILLKYGGLNAHRRAIPFFLGLILGQFVVGSLWTILGVLFNIPAYGIWP